MPHPYGIDEPAAALARTAATLSREVLLPNAASVDANARFPHEALAALAEKGFFGLTVGAELGGLAQGPRAFAAVVEELAGACASTAMIFVMHVAATQALASSPTLAGQVDLLREIARGKKLATLALSERGSRSQFWAPMSQLARHEGKLTTSAEKSWVTAADHAAVFVASARMPGASSPLESTLYLVRRGAEGVRVAAEFDGLGLRGNNSAPVTLSGVGVDEKDLVTAHGEGAKAMLEVVLPWFCVGTAAMALGLCNAALAGTASHLGAIGLEHTGEKLRDLPVLRARVAEMAVRTAGARALLGYTLGELEAPSASTPLFVLQTRLAALEAAACVTDLAMQACGGAAYSRHLTIERLFRDARAGSVMAPTVDHLRDFIGRALTGLPLF